MGVSTEEFSKIIESKISNIKQDFLELTSGDIHREIGGYPSQNHSMPNCCNAMRKMMKENDFIVKQPKKGDGASLTIRYYKR